MRMRDAVASNVPNRTPFAHGSMSGRVYTSGERVPTGRMPKSERDALASVIGPVYVVFSYATPIAWHSAGEWHVSGARYSNTTARHQYHVRSAVAA